MRQLAGDGATSVPPRLPDRLSRPRLDAALLCRLLHDPQEPPVRAVLRRDKRKASLNQRAAARLDEILTAKLKETDAQENSGQDSGQNQESVVTLIFASWNQIGDWLRRLEALQQAA